MKKQTWHAQQLEIPNSPLALAARNELVGKSVEAGQPMTMTYHSGVVVSMRCNNLVALVKHPTGVVLPCQVSGLRLV